MVQGRDVEQVRVTARSPLVCNFRSVTKSHFPYL